MLFGAYILTGDSVGFDAKQQVINQKMFKEETEGIDESIKALSLLKNHLVLLQDTVKEGNILLINNLDSGSKDESYVGVFDRFFPIIKVSANEGRPTQQYSKSSIEVYFKHGTDKAFYRDNEKEGKIRFIEGRGFGIVNYKSKISNNEDEINKILAEYNATILFVHK